jgi:2-methylisocitrate lyase-like PEP mutase family enzyme
VIIDKGTPSPAELQELGVARVTWGGGLAAVAYAEAARVAAKALQLR